MKTLYTVFVSSTYEDLKEERKLVMEHLLHINCVPLGMEYFNASNKPQWAKIKELIDVSDYYVLIVAGKYGTKFENTDVSYTRKEYEYALNKQIPVLSFILDDTSNLPISKIETDEGVKKLLDDFKSTVKNKTCAFWKNPENLATCVVMSLMESQKDEPRPGWSRNLINNNDDGK